MTLYEDPIGKLEYDPATGILEACYHDLRSELIPETKHSITAIMGAVRTRNIKKLLLDSSQSATRMKEEENRYVFSYLVTGMTMTGLQKIAWVRSLDTQVGNIDYISQVQPFSLPFQLRDFTSKAQALEWLNRAGPL